jgi:hypothetical protein
MRVQPYPLSLIMILWENVCCSCCNSLAIGILEETARNKGYADVEDNICNEYAKVSPPVAECDVLSRTLILCFLSSVI